MLRFGVFNLELNEGLYSSFKTFRDEDEYDIQCYHIIVIEKFNNDVIGTYRIQTNEMARKGKGFYSADEFKLNHLGRKILNHSIETGRACIAKDHRNKRVLYLLWKIIYRFMMVYNKRYLFGCCSIKSQDPLEGICYLNYLRKYGYIHKKILIKAINGYECKMPQKIELTNYSIDVPQLMGLYLKYKARICSYPAIDREFKTIDFLMLPDLKDVNETILKRFEW